jgi:hypothetical protein
MRNKIPIILLLAAMIPILTSMSVTAYTEQDPFVTDLIAGQHTDVGDVIVWEDGDDLYVKYQTDAGWSMSETHLHIALTLEGIPQNNGNPPPGQFDYKTDHNPSVDTYTYQIPILPAWKGQNIFIAAHAVVNGGTAASGLAGLESSLPTMVTLQVSDGSPISYIQAQISGGTILDGTHPGWCIDTDKPIYPGETYTAYVYSSYKPIPAGLIKYPENLDLVNWIINQDYVGQPSPGCGGTYTYGDVQQAIWQLLDPPSSQQIGDPCRTAEIVAAAFANGEGYVPGCGEYLAVILVPYIDDTMRQPLLIPVPIPCEEGEETAWADGLDFPGKNWAMYFTFPVEGEPEQTGLGIQETPEPGPGMKPEPKPQPPKSRGKAKGKNK